MLRRILAAAALLSALASPAFAASPGVTLTDPNNNYVGTQANPLYTTGGSSGAAASSTTVPDAASSGTIAAGTAGSAFTVPVNDRGTVRFNIAGLSGTGATLQAQYTVDGTVYEPIAILRPPLAYGTTVTADGQYEVKASGASAVRLVVTVAGSAGTISVSALATQLQGLVGLVGSLPPGTNTVGAVNQAGAPWQVVQTSAPLPADAARESGNLATILARTPPLGQATKAASQPVVIASDQGALAAAPVGCTATQSNVTLTAATSNNFAGVNPNRRAIVVQNTGGNTVTVAMGTTAVAGMGYLLQAGSSSTPPGVLAFNGPAVPTNAMSAIGTLASSITVFECQ